MFKERVLEKFLRYVSYDTQSDAKSDTVPSTAKQKILGQVLVDELLAMGLSDAHMDEFGYVYATLPSNVKDKKLPTVAYIAHMDTAPDFSGANVKPQVHKNYQGQVLKLNEQFSLDPKDFPELLQYKGMDIVTTSGDTLLGADDKSGIATIFTAIEYLAQHPEIPRPTLKVAITVDEEIARGANKFNVEKVGADYGYTIDGEGYGGLEYNNFNAINSQVEIFGKNVHPGMSKNKMINALDIATEFNSMVPEAEKPQFTEGEEGFYHLQKFEGTVEYVTMRYILRDHDMAKVQKRQETLEKIASFLNFHYGKEVVKVTSILSYKNMKDMVEPVYDPIISLARKSMEEVGIPVKNNPIRGGTDGARLSFMGLVCPNVFSGVENAHGKFEYVAVDVMAKVVEFLVKLSENYTKI